MFPPLPASSTTLLSSRTAALGIALVVGSMFACGIANAIERAMPPPEADATQGLLLPAEAAPPSAGGSLLDRLLGVAGALGRNSQRPVRSADEPGGMRALGLSPSTPGLAILCARGDAGALGFSEQCMLARLEVDAAALPGYGTGVGVSGAWFIERAGIDVNYGLAWLSVQKPQRAGTVPAGFGIQSDLSEITPLHLALRGAGTDTRLARLGAQFALGEDGWLRIEGQNLRSQGRTVELWGTPVPVFESDALQVSAGFGAFSSSLTARVIELRGDPGLLNSLDLGISWRTPWRGELTVGATQYWTRGDVGAWPLRELPPADEGRGRVPYVRYQQDL